MDVTDFDAERHRLTAIAIRILGSQADADDVLQEAWLRLSRTDDVDDLPAWLTTVVTRLCLDHLRKRRTRSTAEAERPSRARTARPGGRRAARRAGGRGDAGRPRRPGAGRESSVRAARCLRISVRRDQCCPGALRHRRTPVGEPGEAQGAGHAGASCGEGRSAPRAAASSTAFLAASRGGDLATLLSLLAPDAVMRSDLVGQRIGADPVYEGAPAVAARFNGSRGAVPVTIDGDPGGAWIMAGKVKVAFAFHVEAGLVREIELIADPDVLATLDVIRWRGARR